MNILANFHEDLINLYNILMCLNRGNLHLKNLKFLASKEIPDFCTSLKCLSMRSCYLPMKRNREPPGKIHRKVHFAKWVNQIYYGLNKLQNFIEKLKGKVGNWDFKLLQFLMLRLLATFLCLTV